MERVDEDDGRGETCPLLSNLQQLVCSLIYFQLFSPFALKVFQCCCDGGREEQKDV